MQPSLGSFSPRQQPIQPHFFLSSLSLTGNYPPRPFFIQHIHLVLASRSWHHSFLIWKCPSLVHTVLSSNVTSTGKLPWLPTWDTLLLLLPHALFFFITFINICNDAMSVLPPSCIKIAVRRLESLFSHHHTLYLVQFWHIAHTW